MKNLTVNRFLNTALACFAFLSVGAVAVLNFIYTAAVGHNKYEIVELTADPINGLSLAGALAVLLALAVFLSKYIERIDPKKLFWLLSAVYGVAALYLILNVDGNIRADVKQVYNSAVAVSQGSYAPFLKGGYMERYPHQLGLMYYDSLLLRFSSNTKVLFAANFVFVLGINYFTLKIADFLFSDRRVSVLTEVLSFAFLPQLFFILFGYGLIPGFFFLIGAFYFALRFSREHKPWTLLALTAFSAVAVLLKKNCLIGVVAIVIYLLLSVKRELLAAHGVAILCVLLAAILPGKALLSHYEAVSGQPLEGGAPSVLWLAMGTDPDNVSHAPGWYNGYVWRVYDEAGYDSGEAARTGKEKFSDNIDRITAEPKAAFKYFKDKAVSVWCDPSYQSIWSGPLEDCGQTTGTELTRSVFTGGDGARRVTAIGDLATMFIWLFAIAFLILCRRVGDGWQLPFMYFIGGLLFHTAWEGKSQYVYTYVFVLIPFAVCGFIRLADIMRDQYAKVKKRGVKQ